ncbi:MAG: methanol--cobalamin methyltransferase, partial [Methanomethylovorans sp.]
GGGAVNQDFVVTYELGVYGEEAAKAPQMADMILAGKSLKQLKEHFHMH